MNIEFNPSDIAKVEALLSDIKNGTKKAMVTAINKTVTTTKVQVKKRLRQELNLTAKRINQDLSVEKANYSKISGSVKAEGEPIGLINFKATQLKKGVKVKVLKSNPRTLIKHAFIQTMKKAKNVWWRAKLPGGKLVGRFPVERLTGPRIEDILAKDEIITPLNKEAGKLLTKNLGKQVESILRRYHG